MYFEKFEAKMGSKLSLRFGGRKCSELMNEVESSYRVFSWDPRGSSFPLGPQFEKPGGLLFNWL